MLSTVAVVGLPLPASAETPTEVIEGAAPSNIYVARSRGDFDTSVFDEALASAQSAGLNLIIVLAEDPQPDPKAFALRVRQAGEEVDAVLLVDRDLRVYTSISEEYEEAAARAGDVASSGLAPGRAANAFVRELTIEVVVERPVLYRRVMVWGVRLLVLLVALVVVEILWRQWMTRVRNSSSARKSAA